MPGEIQEQYAFLDVDGTLVWQDHDIKSACIRRTYNDALIACLKEEKITDVVLVTNHSIQKLHNELTTYIAARGNAFPPVTRSSVISYLEKKGINVPYVVLPATSDKDNYYKDNVSPLEVDIDNLLESINQKKEKTKDPKDLKKIFEDAHETMNNIFTGKNICDSANSSDGKKNMIELAKSFAKKDGASQEQYMFFEDNEANLKKNALDEDLKVYQVTRAGKIRFDFKPILEYCDQYIKSKSSFRDLHRVKEKVRKVKAYIIRKEKDITNPEVIIILEAMKNGGAIKTDKETITFPKPRNQKSLRVQLFSRLKTEAPSFICDPDTKQTNHSTPVKL